MLKIMWQPTNNEIANCQMSKFMLYINEKYGYAAKNYQELYQWSIQEKAKFWQAIWQFFNVTSSETAQDIYIPGKHMFEANWFPGAKLNFAENLLSKRNDHLAIIFNNEKNQRRQYTYQELHDEVAKVAAYFRNKGLKKHDRIVAVLPNLPESIIAMLAATSIGAIWSSCSPDFGPEALLERFYQIQPKILIASDGYFYNGKFFSTIETISWLQNRIPSLEEIILVDYTKSSRNPKWCLFSEILEKPKTPLYFEQLPFNHPLYILFSSGTTDFPKCIVHGLGGTLLQHLKELGLHTNISVQDRIFYYTTCGWMMWNWYISSLALGATIVQYDGSPFYRNPNHLLDFIDNEQITVFGTSAKYISALDKNNIRPQKTNNLASLRTILVTGSPLIPKNYDYIYEQMKQEVCLSSISGGTDIISCFALGNPLLPVYRGELQCIGLGMEVKIFDENGKPVINQKGELVCTGAFPSMPIYFWNDPNKQKYQQTYFNKYPEVWAHGDFAEITDRSTMIIYGRSDATLNPGGVRIGTSEIYHQVEKIPEIVESLAVSQDLEEDTRIILFVVLKNNLVLSNELCKRIKEEIRNRCSPRHVPAKIIAVPELPRTLSGKIIELAVKEIIHNRPVKNLSAIANPESLEFFRNLTI
jgi:acetoacetyl-CoA synthetase